MKTSVFCIIMCCCMANVLVLFAGCKSFAREPESLASQIEKIQLTIIDNYSVREVPISKALSILADLCGKKSGSSFSVIVKYPEMGYKQPLVTLHCRSMTVRDIIRFISEETNVFIEFTSHALVADCLRDSQGGVQPRTRP